MIVELSFRACCIAAFFTQLASATTAARVNGDEISTAELEHYLAKNPALEGTTALERLILFRLAVQEAKERKLDRLPDVRDAFDLILYNKFLELELSKSGKSLASIDEDLESQLYEASPLIEVRELVVKDASSEKSRRRRTEIDRRLAKKKDFRALVLKYSQVPSKRLGGRLDPWGAHNAPTPLYETARNLTPGKSSPALHFGDEFHWVQLVRVIDRENAPATYLGWLRHRYRSREEVKFLENRLKEMRMQAKVKIF